MLSLHSRTCNVGPVFQTKTSFYFLVHGQGTVFDHLTVVNIPQLRSLLQVGEQNP